MLDFIDSDSDSDGDGDGTESLEPGTPSVSVVNALHTLSIQAIVQHKKVKGGQLSVLYVSGLADPVSQVEEQFLAKLRALQCIEVTVANPPDLLQHIDNLSTSPLPLPLSSQYDVVLDLTAGAPECCKEESRLRWPQLHALLVPGGVCCAASCEGPPHSQPLWAAVQVAPHCSTETSGTWSGTLHKAAVCCNATAALYWVDSEADSASEQSEGPSAEQTLLEAITVTPTVAQRQHLQQLHLLGPSSSPPSGGEPPSSLLAKAVQALREHGVCILRGFFSPQVVAEWGNAALQDFEFARKVLLESRGIDLYRPKEGQIINNFHELSMREALRVDLRNGQAVREKLRASREDGGTAVTTHPVVRTVAEAAMLEQTPGPFADGNWGLWNFNGKGPLGEPRPAVVGEPGAVISLGGCTDQTVHSDTAHPFTCCHDLPAHYVNLFLIAPDSEAQRPPHPDQQSCLCCDFRVGQTAFIAGSHRLQVSSMCMNGGDEGEVELMRRLLRPHLQVGDALLFDCRALHFGLANTSGSKLNSTEDEERAMGLVRRALLYVNYHQSWFSDPKNWNDNEKLFS